MHFFQQENYEKSHEYFQQVRKYKKKIANDERKSNELSQYANELDSYITACQSILNLEIDIDDQVKNNSNEQYAKQVITKMILIENCIRNNLKVSYSDIELFYYECFVDNFAFFYIGLKCIKNEYIFGVKTDLLQSF